MHDKHNEPSLEFLVGAMVERIIEQKLKRVFEQDLDALIEQKFNQKWSNFERKSNQKQAQVKETLTQSLDRKIRLAIERKLTVKFDTQLAQIDKALVDKANELVEESTMPLSVTPVSQPTRDAQTRRSPNTDKIKEFCEKLLVGDRQFFCDVETTRPNERVFCDWITQESPVIRTSQLCKAFCDHTGETITTNAFGRLLSHMGFRVFRTRGFNTEPHVKGQARAIQITWSK